MVEKEGNGNDITDAINALEKKNNPDELTTEELNLRTDIHLDLTLKNRTVAAEKLATAAKKLTTFYTIRDDEKPEIWMYQHTTGTYVPQGKTYLTEFTRRILGEKISKDIINALILRIHADTYIDMQEFLKEHNLNLICLANGIYNIENKMLTPHDPKHVFFSRINANYDPTATCPAINKFLTEILTPDDAIIIREMFGFLLYRKYFIPKLFILSGIGANGKTQLIRLIKNFLSEENCTGLTPQQITENNFLRGDLFGKLACLAADVSNTDLKNLGILKSLTGEDPLTADRKFKTALNFTSHAKLIFAMNQLPRINDDSDGMMRRFLIIDFRERFYTEKEISLMNPETAKNVRIADRFLLEKITNTKERSGLLNMSLAQLDILIQRGSFSYAKTTEQIRTEIELKSNSIMTFINNFVVEDFSKFITRAEFRNVYGQFCKTANVNLVNENHVANALRSKYPETKGLQNRIGGKPVWVWKNIAWVNDERVSQGNGSEQSVFFDDVNTIIQESIVPKIHNPIYHNVTGVTAVTPFLSPVESMNLVSTDYRMPVTDVTPVTARNLSTTSIDIRLLILGTIHGKSGIFTEELYTSTKIPIDDLELMLSVMKKKGDIMEVKPNSWIVVE